LKEKKEKGIFRERKSSIHHLRERGGGKGKKGIHHILLAHRVVEKRKRGGGKGGDFFIPSPFPNFGREGEGNFEEGEKRHSVFLLHSSDIWEGEEKGEKKGRKGEG